MLQVCRCMCYPIYFTTGNWRLILTLGVSANTGWSRVHPMHFFWWWHWHWQHRPLEESSGRTHKLMVLLSRRRVHRTHWLLRSGQQMGDAEAVPATAGHFAWSWGRWRGCTGYAAANLSRSTNSSERDKTTVGRFACRRLVPISSAHPGLGHHPKLTNGTRWWHPRGGSRVAPVASSEISYTATSLIN